MTASSGMDLAEPHQAGQAQAAPAKNDNANPQNPFENLTKGWEEQSEFLEKEAPHQATVKLITAIIALLGSIALLVSGILLLMGTPLGRLLCLIAAVMLLISGIVDIGHDLVIVYPAMKKFDDKKAQEPRAPNQQPEPFGAAIGTLIGASFQGLFEVAYPLLAAFVMMTGPVREYYRFGPAGDDEFDRYQGHEEY
jgi:hypothetical protein